MSEHVKVIETARHRNGSGGAPFYVSLVQWGAEEVGDDLFVAISFPPDDPYGTPDEQREYLREHTAVLNVRLLGERNIGFAMGNSWRGADHVGPSVVETIAAAHEYEFNQEDPE